MLELAPDPALFEAAAARFRNFFRELGETFVERDDVLRQISLALLCREHVLITGPPGTAKSQLASAVLRRIFDELTGEPSVFARQFTESTVQTDLVGPIDFKTLVDSGRTQHFTDEGMLGAVHAFLDEVFDGRDMLLRAALNVLQERELKQGSRTTRGRIECSLMTSNRYLSDVLENSRPTLLAFVDRIAFNGFVPRGFAEKGNLAAVLRRHVGTAGGGPILRASLSIQDLDVLQAAVNAVVVEDPMCEAIGSLLEMLDAEMSAAVRADATFVPTRYLSTRTAVRCGRVLRAIAVHEKISRPELPLEAHPHHLAWLRLHLLLSGPSPEGVAALLSRETDPNERRQLSILRTEREVFDRVWKKLPPISMPERPRAKPVPRDTGAGERKGPTEDTLEALDGELAKAISAGPAALGALLRRLTPLTLGGSKSAALAKELAQRAVAALSDSALRACLSARASPPDELRRASQELGDVADSIDDATEATRPIARWLRSQALSLIEEGALHRSWALSDESFAGSPEQIERRFAGLEELSAVRQKLLAKGVEPPRTAAAEGEQPPREASGVAWMRAIDRAEDELVLLYDESFRASITPLLTAPGVSVLARLEALGPEVARLDGAELRLAALRSTPPRSDAAGTIKARVLGPRVGALLRAALEKLSAADRETVVREIKGVYAMLGRAGLRTSIAPPDAVAWAAAALLRSERRPENEPTELDHTGYRALRQSEQRLSNVFALAEVALDLGPTASPTPALGLDRVRELLSAIPEAARASVVRHDIERIERAVRYLERWWEQLSASNEGEARLTALVGSKFFRVLLDESALIRFSLEARLVEELFPDLATGVPDLLSRARSLEDRSRETVLDLLKRRGDAAWRASLGEAASESA
jgi:MoxR-like ATPase